MGKGNVCVHGDYEGLFYVDWNNFSNKVELEDNSVVTDYDQQRDEWEDTLQTFIYDFTKKYKSFSTCDKWLSHSGMAVLENELFYIVTEDNEWSMAIKLIQKEQSYYDRGNIANLQAGLYKKYLEGMKYCLFNQFDEIGIYGGAWTHVTIKKTA